MRGRGCLIILAACLAGCGRGGPGEPIYIGHLAPLQSTDKTRFEHTRQGMSLAIEELNKRTGPAGGRQVVVLHVNADEDLDQLQASAVRLLTVNRAVALIGGHNAAQVEKLARAAQPYEAPLITPSMTGPSLAADYLYSLEPSPARMANAVARWLKESVKKDSLAFVFDSRSTIAADLSTSLRAEFQKAGAGNLIEVSFGATPKFKETCESIRQSKAAAWLYYGQRAEWLELHRTVVEAKLNLPCLVGDSVGPIDAAVFDAEVPLYQLTTYFPQEPDKAPGDFQAAYSKRFHAEADIFAAQGYDAVRLVGEGTAGGKLNSAGRLMVDLAAYLKNPFASSTGPLTFDSSEHAANRILFLIQKGEKKPTVIFKVESTAP
jgi:branched-chain amino acid transport system substrate-binding protein